MSDDLRNCITPSIPRREREERPVLNTVIQRVIKTISVRKRDCNTLTAFMEIARRERRSFDEKDGFSSAVIRAMEEYIQHHPIQNPQPTLDRSFNTELPAKPQSCCCVPTCNRKAKFILTLADYQGKSEKFPVCQQHKHWKHERFRFLQCWKHFDPNLLGAKP